MKYPLCTEGEVECRPRNKCKVIQMCVWFLAPALKTDTWAV